MATPVSNRIDTNLGKMADNDRLTDIDRIMWTWTCGCKWCRKIWKELSGWAFGGRGDKEGRYKIGERLKILTC
jgi:hypothetical protein